MITLTDCELASIRELLVERLTETVDIKPYWGEWVGDTTQAFVADDDPSTAPIFTASNAAPFTNAESILSVPCRTVKSGGSVYTAANGQSYALSGLTIYIPAGVTDEYDIYTHQRTTVSGLQTQYYGHFAFVGGRVWSVERVVSWSTQRTTAMLECLEIPAQYSIAPASRPDYILDESFGYILDEDCGYILGE
jgi:hypothetical protein